MTSPTTVEVLQKARARDDLYARGRKLLSRLDTCLDLLAAQKARIDLAKQREAEHVG